jgi:anaerobic selenocysteine-containing dehydrogenase
MSQTRLVETACPLDCPDSCSLTVATDAGRIVTIDGSRRSPFTNGYICAKVRGFERRVYGDLRVLTPLVRSGPRGSGAFERASWDDALDLVAARMTEVRERWGAESVLPFSYGGSNGPIGQDTLDARLFDRFGASRLERTVCAAPTSTAAAAMYGLMPGVSYLDYPHAHLVVVWGANPSATGIHLIPYIREARVNGARLVVVDPRSTPLARQADLHLAVRPGTDVVVALAVHRYLFEGGHADLAFLATHAVGHERLRERARPWTIERAAEVAGLDPAALERFAEWYATTSPAVVRCGWGLERNRNGGNAALAILALPAIGGKFGVRGGGFTMSNSSAWPLGAARARWRTPSAARSVNMNLLGRALTEYDDPPVKVLFVYNCNPVATMPDQNRVLAGLAREDLFTVVFDQVMTDTAALADVVLPATTFLEHDDLAKGYGAFTLQHVRPAIAPVGESRPNADVFADLAGRLGLLDDDDPTTAAGALDVFAGDLPARVRDAVLGGDVAAPEFGDAPVLFVDVFPSTSDRKVRLFDDALDDEAPAGLYAFQPDPATARFPLALISPATERAVSSTLGELRARPAHVEIHPDDAAARAIADGTPVRVYNDRGEVRCLAHVSARVRPGTASMPKGLWRKDTENGATTNALAPDALSDLGGGACFNDARVEIERR